MHRAVGITNPAPTNFSSFYELQAHQVEVSDLSEDTWNSPHRKSSTENPRTVARVCRQHGSCLLKQFLRGPVAEVQDNFPGPILYEVEGEKKV